MDKTETLPTMSVTLDLDSMEATPHGEPECSTCRRSITAEDDVPARLVLHRARYPATYSLVHEQPSCLTGAGAR